MQTAETTGQTTGCAGLIYALCSIVPVDAVLYEQEDLRPYECEGLSAYRAVPMVVVLPETVEENGVAQMVMVKALPIAPDAKLVFRPGGYHLMLIHAKKVLAIGSKVPITLNFKDGTRLRAEFEVRPASGGS
jgi:hypothetical protein